MTAVDLAPLNHSRLEPLVSVDGLVAYDLPEAVTSGGGTRMAPDVDAAEVALLARCMTFKLAILGLRVGGAKIGLRAQPQERADVIRRFRSEIAPALSSGRLMTGPDLGTTEADFAGLPTPGGSEIAQRCIGGVPAEEALTGIGVAAAAEAAFGPDTGALDGRSIALEGFGKMGSSIARGICARGARVAAVSTIAGCAVAPTASGFAPDRLLEARRLHGDEMVAHLGVGRLDRSALWAVPCDIVVPGARIGVIDSGVARRLAARHVVPVANAPYTSSGLAILGERGIPAHADFACSSGGAMSYLRPEVAHAISPDAAADILHDEMRALVRETLEEGPSPFAGAVRMAQRFLATWRPPDALPLAPALAHGA